ncbi:MAG: VWA domain-containing protein [Bacteroidota bacterium]
MNHALHFRPIATLFALLILASGSLFAQRNFPYQMDIDSRSLDTLHTPDATSSSHRYRVTAWGTYSMWEDTVNSSVDPVWIYSFPQEEWAKPEWRVFTEGYPIYVGDQRMLNSHGLRINDQPMPKLPINDQHRYSTIIQGNGQRVGVSLVDWNFKGFVKQDAHANNSGMLHVLIEELPNIDARLCGIDSSGFPTIRLALKVMRDSVRYENFGNDLVLTENGMRVPIDRIDCSERSSNVSVAMVFDRSGSMQESFGTSDRITYTRSAGKKFVDKLDAGDEAAIYSFSLSTTLDQSWTSSKPLLKSAIDRIQPEGWTSMNDAVIKAVDDITLRSSSRRKAIVVLTDGEDNKSQERSIQKVIARAKAAGVPVFAIGLLLDTDDSLRALAAGTGGRYFSVRDAAAMDSVFASIADIVFEKGCCSVYYTSPDTRRNGTYRDVAPDIVISGDTTALTPTGYHAPTGKAGVDDAAEQRLTSIISFAPNPMRGDGMLRYQLRQRGTVAIQVIDQQGSVVRDIYSGQREPGEQQQAVRLEGLPNGTYFLRLMIPSEVATYPIVLVR